MLGRQKELWSYVGDVCLKQRSVLLLQGNMEEAEDGGTNSEDYSVLWNCTGGYGCTLWEVREE